MVVDVICDQCMTPDERAEIQVKAATLTYTVDVFGRLHDNQGSVRRSLTAATSCMTTEGCER